MKISEIIMNKYKLRMPPTVYYDLLADVQEVEEEQEPILDKIRAEIEPTRKMYLDMNDIDWLNGCDYVLSLIDKYKAETEESEETETWNGIHAQITAPKGTFERIFNDADDDNDI